MGRLEFRLVSLSADDPRAPYLQIADDLRRAIALGRLEPGDKLPSARELMDTYGVSTTTAQSAFRLLQSEGLTYSVQGRGTFVRDSPPADAASSEPSSDYVELLKLLDSIGDQIRKMEQRLTALEEERDATGD